MDEQKSVVTYVRRISESPEASSAYAGATVAQAVRQHAARIFAEKPHGDRLELVASNGKTNWHIVAVRETSIRLEGLRGGIVE